MKKNEDFLITELEGCMVKAVELAIDADSQWMARHYMLIADQIANSLNRLKEVRRENDQTLGKQTKDERRLN